MRKIILIAYILAFLCSCATQRFAEDRQESFDPSLYKKYVSPPSQEARYTKDNGNKVVALWGEKYMALVIETFAAPYLYMEVKSFYPDGRLEKKGKAFKGAGSFEDRYCRIGKWIEFDEKSGRYKIVDYDKKKGKITYQDILNFLEQKGYLTIATGEGLNNILFDYDYKRKRWIVGVRTNSQGIKWYHINGRTGKVIKEDYSYFLI